MFLHNQKIGFSMSKAMYMSKVWVYICTICWIFSHLNTMCNSKATDAIIPLFLHNKTSATRRYFCIIKNRTFHVKSNVCLRWSVHLHDLLNFFALEYSVQVKSNECDHTITFVCIIKHP
jgi:hypothetical protein